VSRFSYPISLDLEGKRAVVIGTDAVAAGKVGALRDAGAHVTVVAEGPAGELARLEGEGVPVHRRAFEPQDLEGAVICVASSDNPYERDAIHAIGRSFGVLVNVMDDVEHCDWAAPAVIRRGDLTIAIATSGRSPALARRLREELEARFGPEYEGIVEVIGEVREQTLPALPDLTRRISAWQRALDLEELEQLVRDGELDRAKAVLVERLTG
jgi:precorrin-2 dehydrogenase/sirohydrochlorin ferrochelatase